MRERFADADGRLRATFEIAWLSGWAPHESQQKPLKPGSAAQRLADALGAKEIPAGEKAAALTANRQLKAWRDARRTSSCTEEPRVMTTAMMAGDAGRDQRIFDGGGAAPRGEEAAELRHRRNETAHGLPCSGDCWAENHSSAIRCETSGTSAGGIS